MKFSAYVHVLAYGDNPDDDEDLTWSPYFIFHIDNIEYIAILQCDILSRNSLKGSDVSLGSSLKQ